MLYSEEIAFRISTGSCDRKRYFKRRMTLIAMDDTIGAVSTAGVPVGAAARTILRISGPSAFAAVEWLAAEPVRFEKNRVVGCKLRVDKDLTIEGRVYGFSKPHSYTGQDLCEVHIEAGPAAVQWLLEKLFKTIRPAGPGEFTQRAYLNGKLDLTQAEAVAEIVSSANTAQLEAAQRLLGGRFSETIGDLRERMLDVLGRLEAGLDFSEEPIEFVSNEEAKRLVLEFKQHLSELLEGSIQCERLIDLDSAGLAGVPNAGKSRLLNALLGRQRSIVSEREATTRDVLTGLLRLGRLDCVLFDCAGLLSAQRQRTVVDRLSHQASLEALNRAAVVVFCVDIGKDDVSADVQMRGQISAGRVIYAATKSDTVDDAEVAERLEALQEIFGAEFLAISAATGAGLEALKNRIEHELLALRAGDREHQERLTINLRHRKRLEESVKALADCAEVLKADSTEIAAMLLRQGYEALGGLERETIDEAILERIFSKFCIGK